MIQDLSSALALTALALLTSLSPSEISHKHINIVLQYLFFLWNTVLSDHRSSNNETPVKYCYGYGCFVFQPMLMEIINSSVKHSKDDKKGLAQFNVTSRQVLT